MGFEGRATFGLPETEHSPSTGRGVHHQKQLRPKLAHMGTSITMGCYTYEY